MEGWSHQQILDQLGPIHHYVHDKLGKPLIVTDDDLAGPFTLIRAIGTNDKTVAEQIGGQIFVDGWALVSDFRCLFFLVPVFIPLHPDVS